MHIVDGALSAPVLVGGAVLGAAGVAAGLRKMDVDALPRVGVLSAAFFVASLVHVPVGPSSIHLLLSGLVGLILGWAAFPAMLVALILQAVFFGFGGVTVLGANLVALATPAVLVGILAGSGVRRLPVTAAGVMGAVAGGAGVALTALFVGIALALSGEAFLAAAKLVLVAHLPLMAAEAVVTGAVIVLIRRVRPELLGGAVPSPLPAGFGRTGHA